MWITLSLLWAYHSYHVDRWSVYWLICIFQSGPVYLKRNLRKNLHCYIGYIRSRKSQFQTLQHHLQVSAQQRTAVYSIEVCIAVATLPGRRCMSPSIGCMWRSLCNGNWKLFNQDNGPCRFFMLAQWPGTVYSLFSMAHLYLYLHQCLKNCRRQILLTESVHNCMRLCGIDAIIV